MVLLIVNLSHAYPVDSSAVISTYMQIEYYIFICFPFNIAHTFFLYDY